MEAGFGHFDSCHTENFVVGMLCLVIEVDPDAREAMIELLAGALGLGRKQFGSLSDVQRESRLDPDPGHVYRRADLCLRFPGGPVFVEVKTHARWSVEHVVAQIAAQRASARLGRPIGALLLAPTGLAARVANRGEKTLPWSAVIDRWRTIKRPLVERAVKHLEVYVERPFGVEQPFEGFDRAVQVVACLRELLRACATDIGEKPDEPGLNLTGWDGQAFSWGEWRWHGVSVPLKGNFGRRIGIYRYLAAPPGSQAALEDAWLELYLDDAHQPAHYIRFAPLDLQPTALDRVREEFRGSWAAKLKEAPAATPARPHDDPER